MHGLPNDVSRITVDYGTKFVGLFEIGDAPQPLDLTVVEML